MSKEIFFISDTHFGHAKTTDGTFTYPDGRPLRPFSSVEEMDETMVENWNRVVREHDKVYHLGDVVINKRHLETIKRLNGSKRLIRGNHDIFKTKEYMEIGFKEIYGVRVLEDCILSHIPLHDESITFRFGVNIHGHLHGNRVMRSPASWEPEQPTSVIDPRYFNVSVEQINFTPIAYDDMKERIRKQFEDVGWDLPPRLRRG